MTRVLAEARVHETLAELGIRRANYTIENRGRRLNLVNRLSELKIVPLTLAVGESESTVIARIAKACEAEVPAFLDV